MRERKSRRGKNVKGKKKKLTIVCEKLPDAEEGVERPRFRVDGADTRIESVKVAAHVASDEDADRRGRRSGIRRSHCCCRRLKPEAVAATAGKRKE